MVLLCVNGNGSGNFVAFEYSFGKIDTISISLYHMSLSLYTHTSIIDMIRYGSNEVVGTWVKLGLGLEQI